jgi:Uma2 family endonuclease
MIELVENPCVGIPSWVTDLATFRRWSLSDEFPEQVRISYFEDYIWVDFSMETRVHNRVKTTIVSKLDVLSAEEETGEVYSDGMRLVHPEAGVSTEPDGIFVSKEALQRQRVQFERGEKALELVGSPDMVLEVVSDTSVNKDTKELFELYWKAGIQEYWIVDVRREQCLFDVHRHGPKGYSTTRKQGGWVKSEVFGKKIKLTRKESDAGLILFTLEMK